MSDTKVPADLLAIMQCPIDAGSLEPQDDPPSLVCRSCGRVYPVAPGGIPDMVIDDEAPAR